jgi:hypothetical protein
MQSSVRVEQVRRIRRGGHSSVIGPLLFAAPSDQLGGMLVHELITERWFPKKLLRNAGRSPSF